MDTGIKITRPLVVMLALGGAVLLAWAWQNIHAAFQKGIADGASMRVGLKTSCAVSEETLGSPHFSGCNSIL